ncbi:MAG: hypothetical protein AAF348_11530 [Bacteroidota bacterium]
MIIFYDYETKERLEDWYTYITAPKQGDLVKIGGELKGVMVVVHEHEKIEAWVK